jgi:predicted AAA+ superfamily ATPase
LALHLAQVADESVLARQTHSGAWLENFVLNDLLAWRETEVRKPGIFYRRSASGEEIDFVIEHDRRLLPIEVKAARHLRTADARTLDAFCGEFGRRAPFGAVLYDGDDIFLLTKAALAVPLRAVL